MKYTKLGKSNLTISRICMGCMGCHRSPQERASDISRNVLESKQA